MCFHWTELHLLYWSHNTLPPHPIFSDFSLDLSVPKATSHEWTSKYFAKIETTANQFWREAGACKSNSILQWFEWVPEQVISQVHMESTSQGAVSIKWDKHVAKCPGDSECSTKASAGRVLAEMRAEHTPGAKFKEVPDSVIKIDHVISYLGSDKVSLTGWLSGDILSQSWKLEIQNQHARRGSFLPSSRSS